MKRRSMIREPMTPNLIGRIRGVDQSILPVIRPKDDKREKI
jgi:hypothetical protein